MRNTESGNVLFLILIAVVLFAALSYAVLNSGGGGSTNTGEAPQIKAAQIVQYPSALRMNIARLLINGTSVDELEFNPPSDFGDLTNNAIGVFHPGGSGSIYNPASPDIMENGLQGDWHFNMNFEIEHIGINAGGSLSGNDLIAFLPGIQRTICETINERLGITGAIPNSSSNLAADYTAYMDDSYALPATEVTLGAGGSNGTDSLTGQPYGCFQNNGGDYVYYHVLVEQ